MIANFRWRLDGHDEQVLLIGVEPFGAVSPLPGRKSFSVRVHIFGTTIKQRASSKAEAVAIAERTVDAAVRARLTDDARRALEAAGL